MVQCKQKHTVNTCRDKNYNIAKYKSDPYFGSYNFIVGFIFCIQMDLWTLYNFTSEMIQQSEMGNFKTMHCFTVQWQRIFFLIFRFCTHIFLMNENIMKFHIFFWFFVFFCFFNNLQLFNLYIYYVK